MTTDDLTRYPPLGTSPSPRHIADWERLCAWLEAQPYNASYKPGVCGYLLMTAEGYTIKEYGREQYDRVRRMDSERKALDLVYWAIGYGWRLQKDYAEKLAILKASSEVGSEQ